MEHLCGSLSVLAATNRPLSSPPSLQGYLSVPTKVPAREGASHGGGTFPPFQLPPGGAGPVPIPFFSFCFHPSWLLGALSCTLGCLVSSASVQ